MLNAEIGAELEARTAFVVLLTPASVASYWVKLEIAAFQSLAARDPKRLMLPVRIADCKVPLLMAGIKWIDAVTLSFDATIDAISAALTLRSASSISASASTEMLNNLHSLGDTKFDQGKYAEALVTYERALTISPNDAKAWRDKGAALNYVERPHEALVALDRALALNPGDPIAWYNNGVVLSDLERYDQALISYEKALALDATDADSWAGKGDALVFLSRYHEALDALEEALDYDDENAKTWINMGDALCFLGRFEDAVSAYEEALERDPDSAGAWAAIGLSMEQAGYREEAKAAMRRAQELGWHGQSNYLG